jgi:DNA-binding IclR family transcriptional regulator
MTERTIVSGEELRDELAIVRRRGFAYEDAEHAPDTCGVAAPIRDDRGEVVAAVGMSVPVRRWSRGKDEYTRALVAAVSRVSGPVGANGHLPSIVARADAMAQATAPFRSR